MDKGQGNGTDTLQTDNVFTRKKYIEREAAIDHVYDCCLESKSCNLNCIKDIPASDVVARDCCDRLLAENDALRKERPVRHGRWNYYDSFAWECSNCGWINYHNMGVPNVFNYCPNCGARMDGDGK